MELNFSKNINDSTELQQIIAEQKSRQETNDLLDSDFAYIERGGQKIEGKTAPRSLRHLPISNATEVKQSIEQFKNYPISIKNKEEVFKKLTEAAEKYNVKISESAMPPWLKDKKDDKKDGDKKDGDKKDEKKKEEPKEKSDAVKMEEDDAMMKKMYSRMDEIKKARKDMDKEYAMIEKKLGAMMKKVKASSSEND